MARVEEDRCKDQSLLDLEEEDEEFMLEENRDHLLDSHNEDDLMLELEEFVNS